ncbi:hypothetical protein OIU83_15175 [Flavobacterium sp. LS1R49]|uniref:Uncharacterized protein n=1 Tax=Flavobacterium shii TaxID=2987687 RepID=A0A9X3BZ92_9FLAO|nr:hypothetical protein [Flavobacterium shii]MCV9929006.1 hypothetical protein [Flavobacterium shii]
MNTLATNDAPQLLNSIVDLIDKINHIVAKTVNQRNRDYENKTQSFIKLNITIVHTLCAQLSLSRNT